MSARAALAAVLCASAAILAAAFAFQYWGGLAPCPLCVWQRYPYGAAIAIAGAALLIGARGAAPLMLAGIALWIGAAVAFYHVGVEQGWFAASAACTGAPPADSIEALRAQILQTKPARCDQVPWSLFGISLAGYNLAAALALGAFALGSGYRNSHRGGHRGSHRGGHRGSQ